MPTAVQRLPTNPPFPSWRSIDAFADWTELSSLSGGNVVSRAFLEQTLERESIKQSRRKAEDTWRALEWRERITGRYWPFRFTSKGDVLEAQYPYANPILYAFLAALSLGENVQNEHRKLFEYVVADVVRALSGNFSLVVGEPRRGDLTRGVPARLDDAIEQYSRLSRDPIGDPTLSTDNDLGLDIVTWRSFQDHRGAYLHFIGQCATGRDWYPDKKASDLDIDEWLDHFKWAVHPVRFLAIPFFAPDNATKYRRAAKRGGLLLDRPRILELSGQSPLLPRHLAQALESIHQMYDATATPAERP